MGDPPIVGHSAAERAWAEYAREFLPGKYRRRRRSFLAGWAAREAEVAQARELLKGALDNLEDECCEHFYENALLAQGEEKTYTPEGTAWRTQARAFLDASAAPAVVESKGEGHETPQPSNP